jgi:uncharacterized RDD family membrane protein YckC
MEENQQDYNYEYSEEMYLQQNPYAYRAGFGRRLGAALVDAVIWIIIIVIAATLSGAYDVIFDLNISLADLSNEAFMSEFETILEDSSQKFAPIFLLISFAYFLCDVFFAATIGKMIFGIRIATSDRIKATLSQLFLRFSIRNIYLYFVLLSFMSSLQFFETIGFVIGICLMIGIFFVLAEKRQAFHDMIADTAVFKRDDVLTEGMEINN